MLCSNKAIIALAMGVPNINSYDDREEVIQAWYMDDSDEDQRHHWDPPELVPRQKLGVLSWLLDADKYETDEELKIHEDRGAWIFLHVLKLYLYVKLILLDMIEVCPEKLPDYEEKIKNFFEEHLHTDEEIRYRVGGSGYFDVRDQNDAWIRVWAMRLFVGDPIWTPFSRPHDHHGIKEYIEAFVGKGAGKKPVNAAA
ncbi:hypothetical protein LguiA_002428 [Lonicera macranthoides]